MRQRSIYLALSIILLLTVGVLAASSGTVPKGIENYAKKKGIQIDEIQNITSVDYNNLPPQINVESIDETNLEIYEVNYQEEKLFILTFGGETFQKETPIVENKQFLNFGYDGEMLSDGFLKTSSGVQTSANSGYVMMREGSITGISTNLNVMSALDSGRLEIVIYKNGEAINFGNEVSATSDGVKKDYDLQSKGVVTFEAGDVISVYVNSYEDVSWGDVITMIEITTIN